MARRNVQKLRDYEDRNAGTKRGSEMSKDARCRPGFTVNGENKNRDNSYVLSCVISGREERASHLLRNREQYV